MSIDDEDAAGVKFWRLSTVTFWFYGWPTALLILCFALARYVLKTAPSMELCGETIASEEDFGS